VFDQDVGALFAGSVRDGGSLRVVSVCVKDQVKGRPPGLNTVELLKVASSALNIGPAHAMQVRALVPGPVARLEFSIPRALKLHCRSCCMLQAATYAGAY
jgi:hypothetical protein